MSNEYQRSLQDKIEEARDLFTAMPQKPIRLFIMKRQDGSLYIKTPPYTQADNPVAVVWRDGGVDYQS